MATPNFNWTESITLDCDLQLSADKLNRSEYAKFLTNYLVSEAANGYVLNLNSGWGTGKTYFLKRWQHSIKDSHPTVYIDAWKQDFSDDPLLTVVSSVISQLKEQADEKSDPFVIEKADKAARLFKAVAPALTKGVIKKLTGIKVDEIAELLNESDDPPKVGDLGLGEAAGKLVHTLLDDHNAKVAGAEAFKDSMTTWLKAVTNQPEMEYPAFIFIDELDRCRPSYAVEMLEVIKHIFDMKNVVFVVATDTEQLQHAVKAVYGNDFEANIYLSRFFKRRCTLRERPRIELIKNHIQTFSTTKLNRFTETVWPQLNGNTEKCVEDVSRYIADIADIYALPLRETEQLLDKLTAAILNNSGQKIDILFLASLMIIHDRHYQYYRDIMNEKHPIGVNQNYYEPGAIHHFLRDYDINKKISVSIVPSSTFPGGIVNENNTGYPVGYDDGYHDINYISLLMVQLQNTSENSGAKENHYQKIVSNVSRHPPLKASITNIVGQELLKQETNKHTYRQLVEHASTFDA